MRKGSTSFHMHIIENYVPNMLGFNKDIFESPYGLINDHWNIMQQGYTRLVVSFIMQLI